MPVEYPCSYNQRQIWTHLKYNPKSVDYNLNLCLHFPSGINIPIFCKTLKIIMERHEIMRSTYVERDGELFQQVHDNFELPYKIIDATKMSLEQVKKHAQETALKIYDLENNFSIYYHFYKLSNSGVIFLVCFSHIMVDAWSSGLFFNELGTIYSCLISGQPNPFPPLEQQYSALSSWQKKFINSAAGKEQLNFWEPIIKKIHPLELLTKKNSRLKKSAPRR